MQCSALPPRVACNRQTGPVTDRQTDRARRPAAWPCPASSPGSASLHTEPTAAGGLRNTRNSAEHFPGNRSAERGGRRARTTLPAGPTRPAPAAGPVLRQPSRHAAEQQQSCAVQVTAARGSSSSGSSIHHPSIHQRGGTCAFECMRALYLLYPPAPPSTAAAANACSSACPTPRMAAGWPRCRNDPTHASFAHAIGQAPAPDCSAARPPAGPATCPGLRGAAHQAPGGPRAPLKPPGAQRTGRLERCFSKSPGERRQLREGMTPRGASRSRLPARGALALHLLLLLSCSTAGEPSKANPF